MENPEVFEHYNIEGLPMIYFYTNNICNSQPLNLELAFLFQDQDYPIYTELI